MNILKQIMSLKYAGYFLIITVILMILAYRVHSQILGVAALISFIPPFFVYFSRMTSASQNPKKYPIRKYLIWGVFLAILFGALNELTNLWFFSFLGIFFLLLALALCSVYAIQHKIMFTGFPANRYYEGNSVVVWGCITLFIEMILLIVTIRYFLFQ